MVRLSSSSFTSTLRRLTPLSISLTHPFSIPPSSSSPLQTTTPTPNATRLPTVFVSHGGGPSFFMTNNRRFADIGPNSATYHSLRAIPYQLGLTPPNQPKAIVIISAHWETSQAVHITSRASYPQLNYDYSGFPPHTYQLQYPAPASPTLANRIHTLLSSSSIPATLDTDHNWDHGVFIPLMVMFPDPSIPVVQVSLLSTLDPSHHLSIGRALAPLRDEGVLIVGSGFVTHNFSPSGDSRPFVRALEEGMIEGGDVREKVLRGWRSLPAAKHAHVREEHLIPLHVVAGAGGEDKATVLANLWVMGGEWCFANYAFGQVHDVNAKAPQ